MLERKAIGAVAIAVMMVASPATIAQEAVAPPNAAPVTQEAQVATGDVVAIDATDAQLEAARGGAWWYVAIIGGAVVVKACQLNKLQCARAAHEVYGVYRTAQEAYKGATALACRKGWKKKGC